MKSCNTQLYDRSEYARNWIAATSGVRASLAVPVTYVMDSTNDRQRRRSRVYRNSNRNDDDGVMSSQVVAVIEVVHTKAEVNMLPLLNVLAKLCDKVGFSIGGFTRAENIHNSIDKRNLQPHHYQQQQQQHSDIMIFKRKYDYETSHIPSLDCSCNPSFVEKLAVTEIGKLMMELVKTIQLPLVQLWKVSTDNNDPNKRVTMQTSNLPFIMKDEALRLYRFLCCHSVISDSGPVGCCKRQGKLFSSSFATCKAMKY